MATGSTAALGRASLRRICCLGFPSLAIHDQTFNGNVTGRRWKMYRPYVQDDWRVTQRSDFESRAWLGRW